MAIQNYIGWASKVNRTILEATTLSLGENALRTDELETGHKISIQRSAYVPERYSVKMSFDWDEPNWKGTGKTEYQLFTEWYKYRHKYGEVPFEFPNIAYSTNTGIPELDRLSTEVQHTEYYKITSTIEGSKSGGHIAVTMTWEPVYTGQVSIITPTPVVYGLEAKEDYLDVIFSDLSDTDPVSQNFTLYMKPTGGTYSQMNITGYAFDGMSTARLYHETTNTGTFTIAINNYSGCAEAQGDHESDVQP